MNTPVMSPDVYWPGVREAEVAAWNAERDENDPGNMGSVVGHLPVDSRSAEALERVRGRWSDQEAEVRCAWLLLTDDQRHAFTGWLSRRNRSERYRRAFPEIEGAEGA